MASNLPAQSVQSGPMPSSSLNGVTSTAQATSSPAAQVSAPALAASTLQAPGSFTLPTSAAHRTSPTWLWRSLRLVTKIIIGSVATAATLLAVYVALWTSIKDYRDDCRSQKAAARRLSAECEEALSKALRSPAFLDLFLSDRKRKREQSIDFGIALELTRINSLTTIAVMIAAFLLVYYLPALSDYIGRMIRSRPPATSNAHEGVWALPYTNVNGIILESWVPTSLARTAQKRHRPDSLCQTSGDNHKMSNTSDDVDDGGLSAWEPVGGRDDNDINEIDGQHVGRLAEAAASDITHAIALAVYECLMHINRARIDGTTDSISNVTCSVDLPRMHDNLRASVICISPYIPRNEHWMDEFVNLLNWLYSTYYKEYLDHLWAARSLSNGTILNFHFKGATLVLRAKDKAGRSVYLDMEKMNQCITNDDRHSST